MKDLEPKLRSMLSRIESNDPPLADELAGIRQSENFNDAAAALRARGHIPQGGLEAATGRDLALETIVLRVGRPVLEVFNNDAVLAFRDVESKVWKSHLEMARPKLIPAIQAIGRIEVKNHGSYDWLGTGWLIDENIIVTNRHVAEVFAAADGASFIFRRGMSGASLEASIDFLEEIRRPDEFVFHVDRILYIEPFDGPDVAFLSVRPIAGSQLPTPIPLFSARPAVAQKIAVIGYPARDGRIPDAALMDDIFGNVYEKKRLAPGQLTSISKKELLHDASTLGGNSGSALIDLDTGHAVGLHFAGRFLEANFAVPAEMVDRRLKDLRAGRLTRLTNDTRATVAPPAVDPATFHLPLGTAPGTIKLSIPITLTVGDLLQQSEDTQYIVEGRPEDYADREGYVETFLGPAVPLPAVGPRHAKDVRTFKVKKTKAFELKYCHFSVVMSKSRRQCFFSACNLDGKASVSIKQRPGWRLDPRIPSHAQIMQECYGNHPKFSRGHMTRREDPVWGDGDEPALGNRDSMHVTNAVPQMQTMNGGIWLALENYALQNARKDDMKISVFTGPVFADTDKPQYGVRIPMDFWKIIVFIHDITQRLCATGYMISQTDFLPAEEFIFGQHKTTQRPIAEIETLTGLTFGNLRELDPLRTVTESRPMPLRDLSQIKFY